MDRLWKIQDVANLLGICQRGVWRLIARGDLPQPVKVGRSSRLFETDVMAFQARLKAQRVQ